MEVLSVHVDNRMAQGSRRTAHGKTRYLLLRLQVPSALQPAGALPPEFPAVPTIAWACYGLPIALRSDAFKSKNPGPENQDS